MPRIRTIKPEFWTDEKIVELSSWARLLYIGIWNFADDNGVLEYKPKQIKLRIFPADDIFIEPLLEELARNKLIQVYEHKNDKYLICCNLRKHQVIDKPRKSNLPLPENYDINGNKLKSTEIMLGREGKGREKKKTCASEMREGEQKTKKENGFDKFWIAYPKKKAKGEAEKAWNKAKKNPEFDLAMIIKAVERQKLTQDWKKDNGQFIPYPSTWLNQKRWYDEEAKAQMDDYDLYLETLEANNGTIHD